MAAALRGESFCLLSACKDAPLGQRQGGGSRNTPPCLWPSGASLHAESRQKLSPRSAAAI